MPEPTENDGTQMYRLYNAEGVLLYVGISWSALNRITQHRAEKEWWTQVHRVEISTIPGDRTAAEQAERQAIRSERPLYNVKHNCALKVVPQNMNSITTTKEILTMGEAEKVANVSRSTLRRRLHAGEIPGAVRADDGSYSIPIAGLVQIGLIDDYTNLPASDDGVEVAELRAELAELRAELAVECERRKAAEARATGAEAVAEAHRERADSLRAALEALSRALPPAASAKSDNTMSRSRWQRS